MSFKLKGLVLGAALSALAFSACESTSNTNVNVKKVNDNTAIVVNDNANLAMTNTRSDANTWNANITREEYDKDKDRYEREAKEAGASIGQGANDMWLWTKTRSALMTTDDLRESTINVDVDNAVVTLKGTVANAAQKTKAVQVAKGIDGVKNVKDELKVSPNDSMMDGDKDKTKANSNMNK